MRIQRDIDLERKLMDSLRPEYKERDEIHITELLGCLRLSWLRRKYDLETPDDKVLLYARGGLLHARFWVPGKEELFKRDNLYGRPDGYFEEEGEQIIPLELKSTIKQIKNDSDIEFYLPQLLCYMYLVDSTVGYFGVFQIIDYENKRKPSLKGWRIECTKEELKEHWRKMKERRDILISHLVEDKPPSKDTCYWEWMCGDCEGKNLCEAMEEK